MNRYVIPLCLPQTGAIKTRKAIATGWGRTGFAESVGEKLMKVTIEYFDQNSCDYMYEDDARLAGRGINWSKMVCAGSTNKTGDTCDVRLFIFSKILSKFHYSFGLNTKGRLR